MKARTQQQISTLPPFVAQVNGGMLQRKCASCGNHRVAGSKCEDCETKKDNLQRKTNNYSEVLEAPNSSGQSLNAETALLQDFSNIQIHSDGEQILQRQAGGTSSASGTPPTGTATGAALLHDCATWPRAASLSSVLTTAQSAANLAVQGLQSVVGHWGTPSSSALDKATEMGLRTAFNMEPDKSAWAVVGIPAAEIRQADRRDRAAAQTILTNFTQIAGDAPHYQAAPACQNRLASGSPCLGCVDATHARCTRGATAFVRHESLGQPSSPIFFCPTFFNDTVAEMAEVFLHEVSHLQPFGGTDYLRGTRYYGCPVRPVNDFNELDDTLPGLLDPNDYLRVADSYRCFLQTQREHQIFYVREAQTQRRIEQEVREVLQPPPGGRTP